MIKAIQTKYNGYNFRSRLEARWAVFFDTLGIRYEYEPEGYDLGDLGWYLPDFYLPELDAMVEIKPTSALKGYSFPVGNEPDKILRCASGLDRLPLLLYGTPGSESLFVFCFDMKDSSAGDHWKDEFFWHFSDRGEIKFWFDSEGSSRVYLRTDTYSPMHPQIESTHLSSCAYSKEIPPYPIRQAYTKARSARFEHGETP